MEYYHIFPIAIAVSVVYFIVMVYTITLMEPDYFVRERTEKPFKRKHYPTWLLSKVIKNAIGFFLIIAGIIMLFLPGQGLLTILMGLFFVDFPGKRQIELYLIRKPAIHETINWIRKKANKTPIRLN